jgi:hypothetical protein
MNAKRSTVGVGRPLALALACVVSHAPALRNGYVLDDRILLTSNPFVRSFAGLVQLLSHELFIASAEPRQVPYYRPLSGLLNWLSFQLVGVSAPLQHALNLALHAGVTLLLFRALSAQGVRSTIGFGAALLFAVHPATAEVVAYLGGRQDMLGWLFGLSAVALATRVDSLPQAAALGFGASFFAALCHEMFLLLCVPLALLTACSERWSATPRRAGAAVLGGGALAVAALLALRAVLGLLDFDVHVDSAVQAASATLAVALRLLKDAILPSDLAAYVTLTLPSPALVGLAAVGTLAAATWLVRRIARDQRRMLGPALAGLSLAPLSALLHAGVVLKYGVIADRYAYAMLVALLLIGCAALESWLPPVAAVDAPPLLTWLRKWGVVALSVALTPLTWARDVSWHDEASLQQAMIAERPDDPESELAAGMLAFGEGDLDRAYPHCKAYAQARRDSDGAHLCVGSWLLTHQRPADALHYLRPYVLARPGMPLARRTFLFALLANHEAEEAAAIVHDWSRQFPGAAEVEEARRALAQGRFE